SEEVPYPEDVYIKQVQDEQFWLEEKIWETEYTRTEPFGTCSMYIEGDGEGFDGGRLIDFSFFDGGGSSDDTDRIRVLKRLDEMMYNNSCQNSAEVFEKEYSNFNSFLGYQFQDNCEGVSYDKLLTEYPSIP